MIQEFEKGLRQLDIFIPREKVEKLSFYLKFLKNYNEKVNLTAIKNDIDIVEKHFIDSLLLMKMEDFNNKKVIDIGTGAGFPGMVLAIVNENSKFLLVDSIGKKLEFLRELKDKLRLENVEIIKNRAENLDDIIDKSSFDIGLCRAVSELRVILEYVMPFLKVKGVFFAQKVNYKNEVCQAKKCLDILNSEIKEIQYFRLPFSKDERAVLKILKNGTIDKKYPRRAGVPKKRPL